MEIKTVYKCAYCGTEYKDEKTCQVCEDSHKIGYKNAERDTYERMLAYPSNIVVQFDDDPDDQYVVYAYSRRYTYKGKNDANHDANSDANTEVVEL